MHHVQHAAYITRGAFRAAHRALRNGRRQHRLCRLRRACRLALCASRCADSRTKRASAPRALRRRQLRLRPVPWACPHPPAVQAWKCGWAGRWCPGSPQLPVRRLRRLRPHATGGVAVSHREVRRTCMDAVHTCHTCTHAPCSASLGSPSTSGSAAAFLSAITTQATDGTDRAVPAPAPTQARPPCPREPASPWPGGDAPPATPPPRRAPAAWCRAGPECGQYAAWYAQRPRQPPGSAAVRTPTPREAARAPLRLHGVGLVKENDGLVRRQQQVQVLRSGR
jgi:hypothetical protein